MPRKIDLPDRRQWLESANLSPDDLDDDLDRAPMSDDQSHRLKALCWRLGEPFDASLSAEEADRRIEALERRG